jgi:cyanate lyase
MQHSSVIQDARVALTAWAIAAKAVKDLLWKDIAAGTGLSTAYITAA